MLQWSGSGVSHQGLVRPTNQDAFFADNHLQLWAVADGMGGHPGGDVASRLAIDTLTRTAPGETDRLRGSAEQILSALRGMVESAHHAIVDHTRLRVDLVGMGTTLTLLHVSSHPCPTASIVHEGDSRAYLWRRGELTQLTRDHSMVEEYVRQGLLSPAQALNHPQRHVLSRALGLGPDSDVDVTTERLEAEDVLVLCTDGLTKMVDDERLAAALMTSTHYTRPPQARRDALLPGLARPPRARRDAPLPHPETLCRALITAALQAGGVDNVTVVVVKAQN
ncbi:MAG TPA: protein phosphatase 2C domain-containing protein [Nitrospiraceae bacterium]|nr:protein phosphatase 2C domain-containing protein [Nitrospiraceae bacterium]